MEPMAVSATSWTSSAAVVGGPGGGSIWGFRRQYWGALLLLAAGCSGLYVLLYYRASSSVPSLILRHFQSFSTRVAALSSEASLPTLPQQEAAWGLTQNHRWNLSVLTSLEALRDAIANSSAPPLLTLFSSWADRPDLGLVRNLTLRNWAQLRPFVQPVLFTNSSSLAEQARAHGWQTLPVSREAVGVPILKNMYLDAMDRFNSTLYAFANGDVLFTLSLIHTLLAILTSPHLPLDSQPVLVVGTRVNVNMVTARETETFDDIINMARMRGKVFTTMAEDYFVTDRYVKCSCICLCIHKYKLCMCPRVFTYTVHAALDTECLRDPGGSQGTNILLCLQKDDFCCNDVCKKKFLSLMALCEKSFV